MKSKLATWLLAGAAALHMTAVDAAPQVETPGFFITTIGSTINELAAAPSPYTPDGFFIPLQNVAAMAFAQKADVVFAVEKAGRVRVVVDGVTQELPVVDMSDQVNDYVDSGMGGVAVHPDFPAVKEVLITYTHDNGVTPISGTKYARVARLNIREEVDTDGNVSYFADAPTDNDVIIGRLSETAEFPSCNDRPLGADCGAVDFAAHSFTFVHYGPDGKIYIGTGDGAGYFKPEPHALYAQINDHLSGKILRINPDGSGPEDNPFFTGNKWDNASKVFAKGMRNPKSGSFDPATGKLCVGNVGWFLNEGIYCVDPGDNAGWPCRENGPAFNGYENISLSRDGKRLASCPLDPSTYIEPDYTYAHKLVDIGGELLPIGAVIGCARPTSDEYPENFRGSCVFGDYVFDTIESVKFGEDTVGNPSSSLLLSGAGSPTDLTVDQNGRLCYTAYNTGVIDGRTVSEIRCIGYDDDGSVPLLPVPSFSSLTDAGNPASLRFNASSSFHPAGSELIFSWDFGDGTTAANVSEVEHVYQTHGEYQVTLTATTAGTDIQRTTFQLVNVPDPNFVTPVVPSVVDITYSDNDHEISSPVEFSALVRNDLGTDGFRVLANVYDDVGTEVAHLVIDQVFNVAPGETTEIDFRWEQAAGLGDHTIGIEFYSEDWVSWTLKYPEASEFFVRNRAAAGAGVTTTGTLTPPDELTGTAGVTETDPTAGSSATTADGSTDNGGTGNVGTESTAGTSGVIVADTTAGTGSETIADDGATTAASSAGLTDAAGDPTSVVPDATDLDSDAAGGDSSSALFGCTISSGGNDPAMGFLVLGAAFMFFSRRRGRRTQAARQV